MDAPRPWPRCLVIGAVGLVYFATLVYGLGVEDGGAEAVWVWFTIPMFAITFPLLLLLGRLVAWGLRKLGLTGPRVALGATIAPALLLSGFGGYDGYRSRDPAVKFERCLVSPMPASVRLREVYIYHSFGGDLWAFHFTIAPADVPALLRRRPYEHEIRPEGFDLTMLIGNHQGRPGYPLPPPGFRAVHCYEHFKKVGRDGARTTLYGNAAQTEFFAYGWFD